MRGVGVESLKAFLLDHPNAIMLDMSQIAAFEQCGRRYQYIYRLGLLEKKHISASFSGTILHPALAMWYSTHGARNPTHADPRDEVSWLDEEWREFSASWSHEGVIPPTAKQATLYGPDAAYIAINEYIHQFAPDLDMYEVLSSEQSYWVTLEGVSESSEFVFVSKPDLVLMRKADGEVFTVDFKYSAYEFNEKLLPFDRQFNGQAFVIPATHMIKAFFQVMLTRNNDLDRVKITREIMPVDTELLSEWQDELLMSVRAFELSCKDDLWVKRAPQGCHPFPGITCQFIDLCALGKSRKLAVETLPRANPLEYLGL